MKVSDITGGLERIGLSHYEATVLVNLAQAGAATASELARASGVNRVQTYRALESLEARGLVEVSLDRPRRYAARTINEVFDLLLGEKRAELEAIEGARRQIFHHWTELASVGRQPPSVRLQVIKGRSQIYRTLRTYIEGAKSEILGFTTTKGLQRSYRAGINNAVLAAMARGVRPRLIADINESNRALMTAVKENLPLRHLEGQRARFVVFDRTSILAFLIQDERTIRGDAETALWTNSPDFVKAHVGFFENAWRAGEDGAARLARLRRQ